MWFPVAVVAYELPVMPLLFSYTVKLSPSLQFSYCPREFMLLLAFAALFVSVFVSLFSVYCFTPLVSPAVCETDVLPALTTSENTTNPLFTRSHDY